MTKRLWIFNHYAFPLDRGGLTRPFDFATRVADMGVDVTIFASSFNHWTGRQERLSGRRLYAVAMHDNVRFVWLRTPSYRGNGPRRVLNMCAYVVMSVSVQFRLPRPDVVLGSSAHLMAPLAAWVTAKARRARFDFEVGDVWPQTQIDIGAMSPGGMTARLLGAIEVFLYRRAESIVSLLPRMGDHLDALGIPRQKLVYVPNGIDPDARRTSPTSARGRAALAAIARLHSLGRFVAIYAGAHGLVNRLDVIVSAAASLQERHPDAPISIVLMGDGPDKPALQRLARERGLANMEFLESVPKEESTVVIAAADTGLVAMADLPVYRFGLSLNKVFDYWNCALPVVLSASVPDDPISATDSGLVTPAEDPDALADALVRLAAMEPARRAAIGERGRAYVREHHDLDVLARTLAVSLGLVNA